MGVFQVRNTLNGKIFIGSSPDLNAIWNRFQMQLKLNSHTNKALQQDWNTLGAEHFEFEILARIKQDDTKEINYARELKELEALYLDELQPYGEKGYHKKKETKS